MLELCVISGYYRSWFGKEVNRLWLLTKRWWKKNLEGIGFIQDLLNEDVQAEEHIRGMSTWVGVKKAFLCQIWVNRNKIVFKVEKSNILELFLEFQRRTF